MDITQTITLALIQGLTEFLPVSSSAHLVILPKFLDWPDQGLAFDVVLHFATLCAIIFYYRTTLVVISKDFFCSIKSCFIAGSKRYAIDDVLAANNTVKNTETKILLIYFFV